MKYLVKKLCIGLCAGILFSLSARQVFAHAVVTPNQVGIASTQEFTVSVPTEKDGVTTGVRLVLPPGLNFVTPVTQAGWNISVKTTPLPVGITPPTADDGDVADSVPTEIDWSGGSIPADQKAVFVFSAQVPPQPAELDWKVYQEYADGSEVAWNLGPHDQQPKDKNGNLDFSSAGPYSKTMVINDLTGAQSERNSDQQNSNHQASLNQLTFLNVITLGLSGLSLLLSLLGLGLVALVVKKQTAMSKN